MTALQNLTASWQTLFQLVPLLAKGVDIGQHPAKHKLGRGRGDAGPLTLENFLPLASALDSHTVDFGSDAIDVPACSVPRFEGRSSAQNKNEESRLPVILRESTFVCMQTILEIATWLISFAPAMEPGS